MQIFEQLESEVRSYCRSFPAMFHTARGWHLYDKDNVPYLDFFSGAGALNYGHNPSLMKKRLMEYLEEDGVTHSLDMYTVAKERFLKQFQSVILKPREMEYKIQFPGPTGTNAVESSLKLARKFTGREKILFFTQAFHGMTLGSLSISGNTFKRDGAGLSLTNTTCMPFEGYLGEDADTMDYMDRMLESSGSGIDLPAAAIVETVQAEGGINVASADWLLRLQGLCRKYGMLLILDDIQAGCGRTGTFFSFEEIGLDPDIICLSKSLSGYGLPFSICLLRPSLDIWEPGEHNGTFRGHNLAFVTATEALNYWKDDSLTRQIRSKEQIVNRCLHELKDNFPQDIAAIRGRGLIHGIVFTHPGVGERVSREAFKNRLLVETSGADSDVVKLLPPLVISERDLEKGLQILEESVAEVVGGNLVSR